MSLGIDPWCPPGAACPEQPRALSQCLMCPRPVIGQSGVILCSDWPLEVMAHEWLGHTVDTCQCSGRDCESQSQ